MRYVQSPLSPGHLGTLSICDAPEPLHHYIRDSNDHDTSQNLFPNQQPRSPSLSTHLHFLSHSWVTTESVSALAAPFPFCRYSGGIMTTISGGRKPRNDIGLQLIIHLSVPSSILIFGMLVIVSGHTEQCYWKPVLLCRPNVLVSHARTSEHIQKPSPSM